MTENEIAKEIVDAAFLAPVHKKQLLTYLRLPDKRLGLIINFKVAFITQAQYLTHSFGQSFAFSLRSFAP
jgi:GxxExxY protein